MPKLWIRIGGSVIALGLAVAVASNAAAGGAPTPRHHARRASATGTSASGATSDPAAAQGVSVATAAAKLTDRQMAGQRIIYSYSGLKPPASLLSLIRHGEAGGVIFFGSNITSTAQIKAVIAELDQADASTLNPVHSPLLLMTDQEGGEVRRLPGAPVLSEKQIGQSAHPATEATAAGTGAAKTLRGVGMNLNLAPVLDVYRRAGNFIDEFGRSYSRNPRTVSSLGADFIKAQQKAHVAATAKHFPGLGAAAKGQNTDARPVTLRQSKTNIRNVDELPYKAAIAAGVKLVMASWAVYPALGSKRPAGLSRNSVQGELRHRLGFRGVTITDALEAGALKAFGTTRNRALLAAGAGMDLLLCSGQSVSQGTQAMDSLEDGYRAGTLNRPDFRASLQRVLALRAGLAG
jgi:beta-N-acetylhexosaminidase